MKRLILFTLTASMLALSGASLAQTPAQPAPDAAAPAKAPAPAKATRNPGEVLRRSACRQNADQSLKGPDLIDALQICMLETRLNCLKQAVGDKVRGKKREAFMNTCNGGS